MIDFDVLTGPALREGIERICVGVVARDASGRVLGMRSTADPDVWDMPGGTVEHGESPFDATVREAREELGLDLAAENPQALRRRLVAVIHTQADADHPVPAAGYVFDGGTLTAEQQARTRLDPAEHTEFRFETAHDWRHHMTPPTTSGSGRCCAPTAPVYRSTRSAPPPTATASRASCSSSPTARADC